MTKKKKLEKKEVRNSVSDPHVNLQETENYLMHKFYCYFYLLSLVKMNQQLKSRSKATNRKILKVSCHFFRKIRISKYKLGNKFQTKVNCIVL